MRETIPFVLECLKGCLRGVLARDQNDPHPRANPRTGDPHQFTQTTSYAIRTTAPPTRREVMKPTRVGVSGEVLGGLSETLSTMSLPCTETPSRFRW